jgi:hypothetical protein
MELSNRRSPKSALNAAGSAGHHSRYQCFVSALQFGGKPMALLEMALEGEIQVFISQPIIDETLRVLQEKFKWVPKALKMRRH